MVANTIFLSGLWVALSGTVYHAVPPAESSVSAEVNSSNASTSASTLTASANSTHGSNATNSFSVSKFGSVVKATMLVISRDANGLSLNSSFRGEIRDFTSQLYKVSADAVDVGVTCLLGCSFPNGDTAALVQDQPPHVSYRQLLQDLMEGLGGASDYGVLAISVDARSDHEDEKVMLRRFSSESSRVLQNVVMQAKARLADVVFATADEIAVYIRQENSIDLLEMNITKSMHELLQDKEDAERCYLAVLGEQMRSASYAEAIARASVDVLHEGANTKNATKCRERAITLLKPTCVDTDGEAVDDWGDSCYFYSLFGKAACGGYDDEDFKSASLCCMCGGGQKPNSKSRSDVLKGLVENPGFCSDNEGTKTNALNLSCLSYVTNEGKCKAWDTKDFMASDLCCACGGGLVKVSETKTNAVAAAATLGPRSPWIYLKIELDDETPQSALVNARVARAALSRVAAHLGVPEDNVNFHYMQPTLLGVVKPTQEKDHNAIKGLLGNQRFLKQLRDALAAELGRDALTIRNVVIGVRNKAA